MPELDTRRSLGTAAVLGALLGVLLWWRLRSHPRVGGTTPIGDGPGTDIDPADIEPPDPPEEVALMQRIADGELAPEDLQLGDDLAGSPGGPADDDDAAGTGEDGDTPSDE
jgi:hypothetical protein